MSIDQDHSQEWSHYGQQEGSILMSQQWAWAPSQPTISQRSGTSHGTQATSYNDQAYQGYNIYNPIPLEYMSQYPYNVPPPLSRPALQLSIDAQHTEGEAGDDTDAPVTPTRRQRRHECPICWAMFLRPSGVENHMVKHTGSRPYPCPVVGCDRGPQNGFGVKSNMTRHVKVLHTEHYALHGNLPAPAAAQEDNPVSVPITSQ